jgi:tetratricopeptide (TPR) repeat protein
MALLCETMEPARMDDPVEASRFVNSADGELTASAVFADFVLRREKGVAVDFEALLAERPAQRLELLHLRKEWDGAQDLLGRLAPGASLAASLRGDGSKGLPARVEVEVEALLARMRSHAGIGSRYKPVEEIARGGMGTVLAVWDESLRRSLAMKVILDAPSDDARRTPASRDPRALARFLEEAQITGQLDHPGIVPVHELGVDEAGRAFFTMKLVRGKTFHEVIAFARKGVDGWTETRALGVLLRVCEAMEYAHAKGVIHRDLKPSNIMVGRFGEVYVMDWGLARILGESDGRDLHAHDVPKRPSTMVILTDRREYARETPDSPLLTMDGDVIGTPSYMSPEQAEGAIEVLGPRSDVYSVGAMLYHLLVGEIPYVRSDEMNTPRSIWARVLAGPPQPIEQLAREAPEELAAISEKAMARDPARRYAHMSELAEDLRAYLEGRVVRAHRTGALAELGKWRRRNPLASTLAAVALLSLIALVVVGTVLVSSWEDVRTAAAMKVREQREGLLERGFLALGDGEPLAAAPVFQSALDLDRGSVEALAGLAFARLASGEPGAALAAITEHAELSRNDADLERLELAILQEDVRRKGAAAAEEEYSRALEADPRSVRAIAGVALARLERGATADALAVLERDWALCQSRPALMLLRMEVLRRTSDPLAEPKIEWQRRHIPAPASALSSYLAGLHLLSDEKSYGDAVDQLMNAVLQSSEARPLYYFTALRAAALARDSIWAWRRGRSESESETVQKLARAILTKWPASTGAAENVLHAYLLCRGLDPRPILGERFEQLVGKLAADVARDPENPHVLFRHARALFLRGDFDAAIAELESAIALAPEDRAMQLARVRWYSDAGRYEDAIVLYRDYLAAVPDETMAWDELGALLMDVDDFQGAVDAFEHCEARAGKSPRLHFAIARALLSLARYSDAEARLRAGQALVEAGDSSGAKLAFLANLRRAQDCQKLLREEAALVSLERSPRDHEEVNLFAGFLRAREHYVAAASAWDRYLEGVEPDAMKINYWDAAKSAGFAAGEAVASEDRSYWRSKAVEWVLLYLRACEHAVALEDPSITPEVYARLLHMTQASRAFATLREPLEEDDAAVDHTTCSELWTWIDTELSGSGS